MKAEILRWHKCRIKRGGQYLIYYPDVDGLELKTINWDDIPDEGLNPGNCLWAGPIKGPHAKR